MYARHFGLSAEPFSLTPDPAFLYLSPGHREALAALKVGLLRRCGLMLMTGEVGSGKTTLLYALLSEMEPSIRTAYVANTRVSFVDLLRLALGDFGVATDSIDKVGLLNALHTFLHQCAADGTSAALVVDEAQNLDDDAFEDLRLLSNFERFDAKLLQIILVGQPELEGKLARPNLRQIEERIAVRASIEPLSRTESAKYIDHRLRQVGGSVELFTLPALARIVRAAAGIPRRINILCDSALMFAYAREEPQVTWRRAGGAMRARRRSYRVRRLRHRRLKEPLARAALTTGALAVVTGGGLAITHWAGCIASDVASAPGTSVATGSETSSSSERGIRDVSAAERQAGTALAAPALQDASAAPDHTMSEAPRETSMHEPSAQAGSDPLPDGAETRQFASAPADAAVGVAAIASGAPPMPADRPTDAWPRIVTVAPGANLIRLVAQVYGRIDPSLIQLVQSANPQVVDRDHILVGTQLSFPAAPAPPALAATGSGAQH